MRMLGEGVRNRRYDTSAASRLQLAMAAPLLRIKQLPTRGKWMLAVSLVLSLVLWVVILTAVTRNHLTEEDFLEARKCPVCYGMSVCHPLFNGDIHFTGFSRVRLLDLINVKNVHFGNYLGKEVVLKKLGHNTELEQFDNNVCEEAGREIGCEVSKVIFTSPQLRSLKNADTVIGPAHLKGLSDFTHCPSQRLVTRIKERFKEQTEQSRHMLFRDKIMLLTILKVNPEPLILQTFPSESGYPFPEYIGACGRFIVEGNAGRMLSEYFNAPFHKRVDLAYQILKIADTLTKNRDNFALYWTDLSFDNLAVNDEGKVTVIDVENIQVVDKLAVAKAKPAGWDTLYESDYNTCPPHSNCLSFDPDRLCKHVDSDHNYYAVCRNLLSPMVEDESGRSGGLLHSMPDYARDDYQLEFLLIQCAKPSRPKGRMAVKDDLLSALDKLRIIAIDKGEGNQ